MQDLFYGLALFSGLVLLSWPLGRYLAWALGPADDEHDHIDALISRVLGTRALTDQTWKEYAVSLLVLNAFMLGLSFLLFLCQGMLPLNPDGKPGIETILALHTAISFTTNTNLQHYAGEQSLSYLSQMGAITWLQFLSAGCGIAVLAAMGRALGPTGQAGRLGNFYRDLFRAVFLVLLPLAVLVAILLVLGGVPMTLQGAAVAHTLEGAVQTIARGPVATLVAIKQLGTNGGGYFGPNSTHPLENPSLLTATVEHLSMLLLPMASVWMFGRLIGRMRHAAVVFAVMTVLLLGMAVAALLLEAQPNAAFTGVSGMIPGTTIDQSLGNLEGKELRFGTVTGPLWAASTTASSNGSVAAMHDSLNPLTGLVPLVGMWLNVAFGGVGVGLVNMFLYILVAVFIAGLMVGRTPEYLGRKIESREMTLAALALLLHPLLILGGTALFAATLLGQATISNPGNHGFSQILYEMTSSAANNGSGFEGLGDNTVPWNLSTGLVMLLARYIPMLLPLAIAGMLAPKRPVPETAGTFRTDTVLFGLLLLGSVFLLGALLFLPAAVLGPVAEHLSLAP